MNKKKFRGWCKNLCGGEIKQGATKYCSLRCQFHFEYKMRVELLKRGLYPPSASTGGQTFIRRFLREYYGDRCARCGWNEVHPVTGLRPLEVEHIDGNWQNTKLDNLILLCPNCHALTATYRALNRGRGRAKRLGGRGNPLAIAAEKGSQPRKASRRRLEPVETEADLQIVLDL